MTNVTITISEDVLRKARARAAHEGTSVSKVLRRSLEQYSDTDAEVASAWDEFLAIAERAGGRSPGDGRTWRREDLQRNASRAS